MTIIPDVEQPMALVKQWLDEALEARQRPNPCAMTLATVAPTGRPSARVVLIKGLDVARGYTEFFTNYRSRKAAEIGANAWGAGVVHWDRLGRQLRFEGPIVKSPAADSDAYFESRPWRSQINAWASRQSQPLADLAELEREARRLAAGFSVPDPFGSMEPDSGAHIPRPEFWGGYRFWLAAVEIWASGRDRFHERLRFERELEPDDLAGFAGAAWRRTRLQP